MDAHNTQVDAPINRNLDRNLENGTVRQVPLANGAANGTPNGRLTEEKQLGNSQKTDVARRGGGGGGGFMSRPWLLGQVEGEHADLVLLAHSLATGLVDAASFSNWGVFVGMQTGRSNLYLFTSISGALSL